VLSHGAQALKKSSHGLHIIHAHAELRVFVSIWPEDRDAITLDAFYHDRAAGSTRHAISGWNRSFSPFCHIHTSPLRIVHKETLYLQHGFAGARQATGLYYLETFYELHPPLMRY